MAAIPSRPPNWQHIRGSFYIVRTQAGFKQALKHFNDGEKPSNMHGYPRSYPSFVALSWGYEGYTYVRANCIPINDLAQALAGV